MDSFDCPRCNHNCRTVKESVDQLRFCSLGTVFFFYIEAVAKVQSPLFFIFFFFWRA